jgi:hypothetical protein
MSHILILFILLAFPNGLPSHLISVILTTPLQYHYLSISSTIIFHICRFPSIHLPHTETCPWGPHPPLVLFRKLHPHRPSHLTLGHLFLYLYTQPKLFFIYLVIVKSLCFHHLLSFLSSPLMTFFSRKRNPCRPWLGHALFFHSNIVHKH